MSGPTSSGVSMLTRNHALHASGRPGTGATRTVSSDVHLTNARGDDDHPAVRVRRDHAFWSESMVWRCPERWRVHARRECPARLI